MGPALLATREAVADQLIIPGTIDEEEYPARVMERSREFLVRLPKNHQTLEWLKNIRARIALLAPSSTG